MGGCVSCRDWREAHPSQQRADNEHQGLQGAVVVGESLAGAGSVGVAAVVEDNLAAASPVEGGREDCARVGSH